MANNLFVRKSIEKILGQADASGEHQLKRTLGALQLTLLGIGAIIGAGLFVRTAAAAGGHAGSGVVISYIIAAVGCAFAGLCYAEFSSMIPIAGSAYTYAYSTMGELVAWIIGWALVLEYALGAATVSIAWSEYLNNLLTGSETLKQIRDGTLDVTATAIPFQLCHSPLESAKLLSGEVIHGLINLPALAILLILTAILIKGTQESAFVNAIIVFLKVAIVLMFIYIGWKFFNPENHVHWLIPADQPPVELDNGKVYDYSPSFNHGWLGVLRGAAIVFFAFIGFDAVSTAAQEAKNPKRDMPIGILGSLVICTILYVLFSYVLTGVAPFTDFMKAGKEASVAYAIQHYMEGYTWLATLISIAILAGFSSVILVMLLGQSRVFYSMSKDRLLPKVFADLHPKFKTPWKSNMILFVFVGVFAGFIPGNLAGDLTSIGTLFAFVLVCVGIWILRRRHPEMARPFRTPLVPLVPILGIIVCGAMIVSLDKVTQLSAFGWMLIGLVIYFLYSRHHSVARKEAAGMIP